MLSRVGGGIGLVRPWESGFGVRGGQPVSASGTLVITSGAVTLINGGETAVTVTDGTNPVTGCTLLISDSTKAVAVGQEVIGTAESGTYTVTATKAGYTNSSPVTFTCSGNCFILDPASGTNTVVNGGAVTSWADSAGNSFTGTGTYLTSGTNGKPAVSLNGTTDTLASPSTTSYNASFFYELLCIKPTANPASNRSVISSNNGSTSGYICQIDTSNNIRMTVLNGTSHVITGAAVSLNNPHYLTYSIDAANCSVIVDNGSAVTTGTGNYTVNGSALVSRLGCNVGATGNFTACELYLRIFVARTPTATEIAQLQLRGKNLLGL